MSRTVKYAVLTLIILAACPAMPTRAQTCLTSGCHQQITAHKYLHGPVAAEQSGSHGCTACHVPAGRECSQSKGGSFKPMATSAQMCQTCHSKGTGTQHSAKMIDCLKCHDPHGSNRGIDLQRG